ncbi:MAG: hypothetical protein KDD54_15220 [Flavobacteriales bacterium]|nr:hypothetical protein [Flavobacteriales bacterium]
MIRFVFLTWLVFYSLYSTGQTIHSIQSGKWQKASTWDCNCIPGTSDTVIIGTGDSVWLGSKIDIANLTIEAGAVFDGKSRAVTVTGQLSVPGHMYLGSKLTMSSSAFRLSGTGTIDNNKNILISSPALELPASTDLTVTGNLKIDAGGQVTSSGTLHVGKLIATDATSHWTNSSNSHLYTDGPMFSGGTLYASAANNGIHYTSSSKQDIIVPADGYYHLIIQGSNNKPLQGNVVVYGNLELTDGNLNLKGYTLAIHGNFTQTGGSFNPNNGKVILGGNQPQSITTLDNNPFYDLEVAGSDTKTLQSDIVVKNNLTISSALDVSTNSRNIELKGNWINTGTFTSRQGTVSFSNNIAQTISGTQRFCNVECNNRSGVSIISGMSEIKDSLKLARGEFNTNDSLGFYSSANRTGRLATMPSNASLTGKIFFQRYIGPGTAGFRHIGFPVTGATVNELNDDLTLTGIAGTGNGYESYWTSMYSYDEDYATSGSIDSGWTAIHSVLDTLYPFTGYSLWVYKTNLPCVLNVQGTPIQGNVNIPLTYASNGSPSENGWNLVSNPYPSAINWDHSEVVYNASVGNGIYVWNANTQQYASYVNHISTNGGSAIIAPGQGFYVLTTGVAPTLSMTENVKTNATANLIGGRVQSTHTQLRLALQYNGLSDETVLYYHPEGHVEWDFALDAAKIPSINAEAPYLASNSDRGPLSINAISPLQGQTEVPITISVATSGRYQLNAIEVPEGQYFLWDNELKKTTPIVVGKSITLDLKSGEYDNRYSIILIPIQSTKPSEDANLAADETKDDTYISKQPVSQTTLTLPLRTWESSEGLSVDLRGWDQPVNIRIVDLTGRTIYTRNNVQSGNIVNCRFTPITSNTAAILEVTGKEHTQAVLIYLSGR